MSCAHWEEAVALHAGGDLAPGEAARLEAHLAGCPVCRALLEDLQAERAGLSGLRAMEIPEAALDEVRQSVLEAISREKASGGGKLSRRTVLPPWKWALAASALLILGIALRLILVSRPSEETQPHPIAMNRPVSVPPEFHEMAAQKPVPETRSAKAVTARPTQHLHALPPHGEVAVRSAEHVLDLLSRRQEHEPTVIRLQTNDPDIVITWLVENSGG